MGILKDAIKLAGINWLVSNLNSAGIYSVERQFDEDINNAELFSQEDAVSLAREQGFRLPKLREFSALYSIPNAWDNELKGRWFAEKVTDLGNKERSIFLPAAGHCRNSDISLRGFMGFYWEYNVRIGQFMSIDSSNAKIVLSLSPAFNCSARCVEE